MPHEDAILEQALAELAELSRRVADLTATVSALTARPDVAAPAADGCTAPAPDRQAASERLVDRNLGPAWPPFSATASTIRDGGGPWSPWPWWAMPSLDLPSQPQMAAPFPPPMHTAWGWPMPHPQVAVPPSTHQVAPQPASPFETAPPASLPTDPAPAPDPITPSQAAASPEPEAAAAEPLVPTGDTATNGPSASETTTPATGRQLPASASAGPSNRRKKKPARKRNRSGASAITGLADSPSPAKPAAEAGRPGRGRRRLGSMVISTSLHGLALALLAMVFVTREAEPEPLMITSSMTAERPPENPAEVEIEPLEPLEPVPEELFDPVIPDLADLEPLGPAIDNLPAAGDLPTVDTVSLVDDGLLTGPTTADLLAPIGSSDAGQGGGGRGGSMASNGAMFFGTPGAGTSICFLCDNSRSYDDGGFEMVVGELMRSVASLKPEQSFFVVFFSDEAYPMFFPDVVDTLMPATDDNKRRLQTWLAGVEKRTGGQGLRDAMAIVESIQPASICFLSDGDHSESLVDRMVSADLGGAVVNTFGMQNLPQNRSRLTPERLQKQQQFNQNLLEIATAHGGVFTPVTVRR